MHPTTLLLGALAAATVSAQDLTNALASLAADPAISSLVAEYETADPTSLLQSASVFAGSVLNEISGQAATATGSEAAYLSGIYTSLQAGLSSANAAATSALTITGTNSASGAQQTSGADSDSSDGDDAEQSAGASSAGVESQTGNGAAATAVPIAMGAVGMAVLGML